jgi:osmotically inducible lipoprotein OsmB
MFRNTTLRGGATAALFASALALAGCGSTPGDRIVSGGLLGAGAGAAIGSLDGNAGRGAVIGGVAGGTLGALSTPRAGYGYYRDPYYNNGYYRGYSRGYSYYQPRCVRWSYYGRCLAYR